MRSEIVAGAALIGAAVIVQAIIVPAIMGLSATAAKADEWCGYTTKDNAVIECGYTTAAGCESAVGKGGMCFVDPDLAREFKRATPVAPSWPDLSRRSTTLVSIRK